MPQAVVGTAFHSVELSQLLSGLDRVQAAGFISDQAARRAFLVRGRLGPEGKMVSLRNIGQHHALSTCKESMSGEGTLVPLQSVCF